MNREISGPIWLEKFFIPIIIFVGIAARFYDIDFSFDVDEIFSIELASSNFNSVIERSLIDSTHPPLHNILLHFWIIVFGSSEISGRCLSVIFSIFFLIFSYLFLRKICDKYISIGLLSVLAISPFFVFYGQMCRPYALIAWLWSMNLYFFSELIDSKFQKKWLFVWAFSCTLLLYAQYMGIFCVLSVFFISFVYFRERWLEVVGFGVAGCCMILPWLLVSMAGFFQGGVDPIPQINWLKVPTLFSLFRFYASLLGRGWWFFEHGWLVVAAGAALSAWYSRSLLARGGMPPLHLLSLLLGVGFPLTVFLVSVWGPKPIFLSRQLIGAAFATIVFLGAVLTVFSRPLALVCIGLLLAWIVSGAPDSYRLAAARAPWKEIVHVIDARYGSEPLLCWSKWVHNSVAFYRTSAPVGRWDDSSRNDEHFLFLCRRDECREAEGRLAKTRHDLVTTFRWSSEYWSDELRLYEVADNVVQ